MKTYSEKLRDPRWQKKRLEIMERDGFKCAYCHDASSTLNVHHAYYIKGREPWEYDQEMLITVCEECHELIEESKRAIMKTSVTDIMAFRVCAGIARSNCTAFVDSIHVWGVLKNKASADLLIEQIKSLTV